MNKKVIKDIILCTIYLTAFIGGVALLLNHLQGTLWG